MPFTNALIFMCYFLRKAHSTEQTPFTRMSPSGSHWSDELTEAMRIKCRARRHKNWYSFRFEPSNSVSRNRRLIHATNMRIYHRSIKSEIVHIFLIRLMMLLNMVLILFTICLVLDFFRYALAYCNFIV